LEVDRQITDRQTKYNLENGKEYAKLIKTPYWNLMLEKQVTKTEERPARHKLFLPEEMVRHEVWTWGFKEETIKDDNLHTKRCNQLLIHNGCNILLNHNL
jgi:hypothetical protein